MKNIDNELLEPWGPIGHVDEVNGLGAQEVPEFIPTRHELIQILKYLTDVRIEYEYYYFLTGITGSTEYRQHLFAQRRIDRIERILGEEGTRLIENQIAEFGKTVDPKYWDIFLHGTAKERDMVAKEVQRRWL